MSSLFFNRPVVLPLGRAARLRLLRATTPRPPRLQPLPVPTRARPRRHINTPTRPRLFPNPYTERSLTKTTAALSVRRRAIAGALRRRNQSHWKLCRVHRSPFDASPSRPDRVSPPSATSHLRRLGPPSPSLLRASPSPRVPL